MRLDEDLVYGDGNDEYEAVTEEDIIDHTRWSVGYSKVFRKKDDGTFWKLVWYIGATEYQGGIEGSSWVQVYPKEITITIYEALQ